MGGSNLPPHMREWSGANPITGRVLRAEKGDKAMNEALDDEILNLDEASRYLRIKPRTLYTLAAQRKVPAVKIGGQWRFRKYQLNALFENGQQAAAVANGAAAS